MSHVRFNKGQEPKTHFYFIIIRFFYLGLFLRHFLDTTFSSIFEKYILNIFYNPNFLEIYLFYFFFFGRNLAFLFLIEQICFWRNSTTFSKKFLSIFPKDFFTFFDSIKGLHVLAELNLPFGHRVYFLT